MRRCILSTYPVRKVGGSKRGQRAEGQKNIFVEDLYSTWFWTEERHSTRIKIYNVTASAHKVLSDCEALWKGIVEWVRSKQWLMRITVRLITKGKRLGKDDFTKCPNGASGSGRTHDPSVFRGCYDGKDQSGKSWWKLPVHSLQESTLYPKKAACSPERMVTC